MLGLENLDGWKLLVVALVGIFIVGPDRLPKAIAEGVRMLRNLRRMARNATSDLSRELGTDIQLEDLNPKALIRKHLLSEDDEQALRRPLENLYRDLDNDVKGLRDEARSVTESVNSPTVDAKPAPAAPRRRAIDVDAT
jgi:sec-independent protein translocase protein TatB